MTDKCYPINIDDIEKQYYAIYNLEAFSFLNREESTLRMSLAVLELTFHHFLFLA